MKTLERVDAEFFAGDGEIIIRLKLSGSDFVEINAVCGTAEVYQALSRRDGEPPESGFVTAYEDCSQVFF